VTSTWAGEFIALCFAIFWIYWIIAAFSAKRTVERHGWWGGWRLGLLIVVAILLRSTVPFSGGAILWRFTPALGIAADLVTLVGLILTLWARATLGGNWSSAVVIKEDHELIVRGPYRYVRHPIYSGTLLMLLGMGILLGRTTGLMLLVACAVILWIKLRNEERVLAKHFPEAYSRYKVRVKALVPFVL
jgi:protein-S-isoprenylcysteine O-methyltransferase Ste14